MSSTFKIVFWTTGLFKTFLYISLNHAFRAAETWIWCRKTRRISSPLLIVWQETETCARIIFGLVKIN